MAFKTILLHLDGGGRDDARLDIALGLAAQDEAHLVALCTIPPIAGGAYGVYAIGAVQAIAEAERVYFEEARAEAGKLRERVAAAADKAGVTLEWRLAEGYAEDIVPLQARYADLAIVGQADPDAADVVRARRVPVETAMQAGGPILVVPYAGAAAAPGKRPLIAWNGSREATRAVHDALPILRRADSVAVLSIDPSDSGHIAGFDIPAALARHGVTAEARRTVSSDVSPGDILLS
jgi:hypothetical protein